MTEPSGPGPVAAPAARGGAGGPSGRRPPRALIFSVTLTGIMANTLIAPAVPDILVDLDLSEGQAGLLIAAAAFPGIFVAPIIGLLADRYGRRPVLVPCLVLFGVFGGLASFAPSFEVLLLCRLGQGLGTAALINLAVVLIGDHWEGADRARVIGQNSAVLTTSIAIMPPLGGLLTDLGGWRFSFVPYWLGLVTAIAVVRVLPPVPRRDVTIADQVREAAWFLRSPSVVGAVGIGFVVFMLIFGLFLTVLPIYAAEGFGLGGTARGLLLGVPAVTSTTVALVIGRLRARHSATRLVLAGSAGFALAFGVIAGAPAIGLVVAGALLYGAAEGLTIPTLQDVVAGSAPASSRGSVMAVWVGAVRLGQASGPVIGGVALGALGGPGTFLAGAGVALALLVAQAAYRPGARTSPSA